MDVVTILGIALAVAAGNSIAGAIMWVYLRRWINRVILRDVD